MDDRDLKYLLMSSAADFARWIIEHSTPKERNEVFYWLSACHMPDVSTALALLSEEQTLYDTVEDAKNF